MPAETPHARIATAQRRAASRPAARAARHNVGLI